MMSSALRRWRVHFLRLCGLGVGDLLAVGVVKVHAPNCRVDRPRSWPPRPPRMREGALSPCKTGPLHQPLHYQLGISLQTMLFIISILESHGYDSGTEVMGGILVGISFLIRRYMRKNLYLFGSSALGTLFVIYGYFIMNGQIN